MVKEYALLEGRREKEIAAFERWQASEWGEAGRGGPGPCARTSPQSGAVAHPAGRPRWTRKYPF